MSSPSLGPLNLGRLDLDPADNVRRNYELIAESIGVDTIVGVSQVHGTDVFTVTDDHLGTPLGAELTEADGLVTTSSGVGLVIKVADCVPILLSSHDGTVIGACHAGRRGWLDGVIEQTIDRMIALGATGLRAWIGPHICAHCYEVPAEMAEQVGRRFPQAIGQTSWGTPSLDLEAGCAQILLEHQVQVFKVGLCTYTSDELSSYRRDGDRAGRVAGIIWRV